MSARPDWNTILKRRAETIRLRRAPLDGQDSKGRFVKGNSLSPRRGRPPGSVGLGLYNYRTALERACSPQDLFEITRKAVADAKKGDHYARMYLARVLGLDALKVTLTPQPGSPIPAYRLDLLTPAEMMLLDQLSVLSAKMLMAPPQLEAPMNGSDE